MEVECLKLVKSCAYKDAGCNFEVLYFNLVILCKGWRFCSLSFAWFLSILLQFLPQIKYYEISILCVFLMLQRAAKKKSTNVPLPPILEANLA